MQMRIKEKRRAFIREKLTHIHLFNLLEMGENSFVMKCDIYIYRYNKISKRKERLTFRTDAEGWAFFSTP